MYPKEQMNLLSLQIKLSTQLNKFLTLLVKNLLIWQNFTFLFVYNEEIGSNRRLDQAVDLAKLWDFEIEVELNRFLLNCCSVVSILISKV